VPRISTSDGISLNVDDEGEGPTVVLINGYGAGNTGWALQQRALRDEFRVVSIDRRSHGLSDGPAFGHRMARHGKDIADVLAAMDLDDALLVGASMGSNAVLAYIDLFGPERVRGVVLVDQTPKMINDESWDLGMYDLTRASLDAFVEGFPGGLNPFHAMPSDPEVLDVLMNAAPFSIDDTRALLRDHAEADWRDVLPRVNVPLTAIAGRHSPFWPCASSEWMANAAPHGSFVAMENSGHVPFLEEPAAFNDALVAAARA
jgi:pimeloyl-ACP methyl ester carboxylesterase